MVIACVCECCEFAGHFQVSVYVRIKIVGERHEIQPNALTLYTADRKCFYQVFYVNN